MCKLNIFKNLWQFTILFKILKEQKREKKQISLLDISKIIVYLKMMVPIECYFGKCRNKWLNIQDAI